MDLIHSVFALETDVTIIKLQTIPEIIGLNPFVNISMHLL